MGREGVLGNEGVMGREGVIGRIWVGVSGSEDVEIWKSVSYGRERKDLELQVELKL
jgi:hypothetical protein